MMSSLSSLTSGVTDKTNRPNLVPGNFSNHKSVGGNAHGNCCLLHLLPLMIGLKVPEDEPVWQMLMTWKGIVELVMSPSHTEEIICYLDSLISEHRSRLLEAQQKLIPKHHFFEHYAQLNPRIWSCCCSVDHEIWSKTQLLQESGQTHRMIQE